MVGFITSEAREKAAEIEQEADETYTIEKQRMIEAEKKKIKIEYERKEKQVSVEKRIQQSNLQKEQRLRVLKERERLMQEMLVDTRTKMTALTKDLPRYSAALAQLIAQSAVELRMGNATLVVIVMKRDQGAVKGCLNDAKASYKKACGHDLQITVSDKTLDEAEQGGVIVESVDGRIKSINTFKAREESIYNDLLPRFRNLLFE
eukprot:NODE_3248_length_796_cov_62.473896_g2711_i0.p1 GENE.NODE_3248_length_796_cov_62.473896_g2711_i0~~NODE_3248_length_796_cov_62.473896_g2711_i0.p1  ORF type:complete len:236 (+),score=68.81 NODE_3248_length_796_cov_62.473896_g2711_i0:95-709(+)